MSLQEHICKDSNGIDNAKYESEEEEEENKKAGRGVPTKPLPITELKFNGYKESRGRETLSFTSTPKRRRTYFMVSDASAFYSGLVPFSTRYFHQFMKGKSSTQFQLIEWYYWCENDRFSWRITFRSSCLGLLDQLPRLWMAFFDFFLTLISPDIIFFSDTNSATYSHSKCTIMV